jgi:hypothetical protein
VDRRHGQPHLRCLRRRRRHALSQQEPTNGCIFIVDAFTPPLSNPALLNRFEPQLIKDIQSEVGARTKSNIGTMNVLSVL